MAWKDKFDRGVACSEQRLQAPTRAERTLTLATVTFTFIAATAILVPARCLAKTAITTGTRWEENSGDEKSTVGYVGRR